MTSSEYRKLSKFLADMKIGSREAFSGIYSMYEKKVYFLCCKILGSKNEAKKLTEDVFDYAYLQILNFTDAAGFEKWLYKTIFSKCRQFILENRPEVFGDYVDSDSSDGEQVDVLLVQDADEMMNHPDGINVTVDMMQTVDSVLSALPQKIRNVALLHYFCGFDGDEIAAIEQISYAAFRNRLYKARIRIGTEEHKYTEMGYKVAGFVTFLPDVLTTMSESIVIPGEIAAAVTSRTGVNCMAAARRNGAVSPTQNTTVIPAQKPKTDNYQVTTYARRTYQPENSSQEMSPAVKVIMAIVAILIIIGGTVAVTLAIQNNKNSAADSGAVENFDNNVVPTTIEVTTKAPAVTTEVTTQETTVETTAETTAEATTEETTQETTEAVTESTTEVATAEATTEETTLPLAEPEGGNGQEEV